MSDEEEGSEAPKSSLPLGKNTIPIIGGIVVVVVGVFAYSFVGEKVVEVETRDAAVKVETKKQEVEAKNTAEANRVAQREDAERKHALEMEKQRLQAVEREAARAKAAADQEAAQAATAAAAAQYEERQRQQKEELERRRKEVALKKIVQLRNLAQTTLEKFKLEMTKLDTELDRLIPITTDEIAEKLRSGSVAANNQIKYAEKKIEETNLQLRENQKKPGTGGEQIGILNRKIEGLRADQVRLEAAIQKNQEDTVMLTRNRQTIKDLLSRRANLQKTIKNQVVELKQLRGDPAFVELTNVGGAEEVHKMIADATALSEKEVPDGTIKRPEVVAKPEPIATPQNGDSTGVTVSAKKEKVTVYTLKNGKTVSATKAVDAGDMLSVKTMDGKFQSIFKEDIVKEESKEQ